MFHPPAARAARAGVAGVYDPRDAPLSPVPGQGPYQGQVPNGQHRPVRTRFLSFLAYPDAVDSGSLFLIPV